jgi:hypothetical protein
MKFHLRIFDNYHHWDEASSYDHGNYETYEEAVIAAKKIVEEFFEGECKPGVEAGNLRASFAMYGEEPVVFPDEPSSGKSFSPREYAEEYVLELCKNN